MSDRAASMKTAKRRINTDKHQRVTAVIAQIKDQGRDDQLKATVIARRAGVHRSFVSNHTSPGSSRTPRRRSSRGSSPGWAGRRR
jgi:hypothetical protein